MCIRDSINEVLKDLDKMLRRLIDETIELTILPGAQLGRVKADSGYVGQVVMNLAAVSYTHLDVYKRQGLGRVRGELRNHILFYFGRRN